MGKVIVGKATAKICASCRMIVPLNTEVCPNCYGYLFSTIKLNKEDR